jgi:DNA end-binding protein Ku
MTQRSIWKGHLKVAQVICPVALYAAASTSDRVTFHTINRATGNRVQRDFIDSETGKPVARDDQAKGYEVAPDTFVVLEPDELAAAVPDSDKTLNVRSFIACGAVDGVYFDKPYFLAPQDADSAEAFVLLRDGMRSAEVAALAQTVLFRRLRTLLIRPHGTGLIGTTLHFDYEVRAATEVFADMKKIKITGEMLDLAKHIIVTKTGKFDPETFDDRYDAALADLVKAKMAGRKITPRAAPKVAKSTDLLAALRESAKPAKPAPKRKAG